MNSLETTNLFRAYQTGMFSSHPRMFNLQPDVVMFNQKGTGVLHGIPSITHNGSIPVRSNGNLNDDVVIGTVLKPTHSESESANESSISNGLKYDNIRDTIAYMQEIPEWEDLHLRRNVGERALNVISVLENHFQICPPKIMNERGEALILTWENDVYKFYLYVIENEIYFVTLNKISKKTKSESISYGNEVNQIDIIKFFNKSSESEKSTEFSTFLKKSRGSKPTVVVLNFRGEPACLNAISLESENGK